MESSSPDWNTFSSPKITCNSRRRSFISFIWENGFIVNDFLHSSYGCCITCWNGNCIFHGPVWFFFTSRMTTTRWIFYAIVKNCHHMEEVSHWNTINEAKANWIYVTFYWEVRLKPSNIALSLALHRLPDKGRDRRFSVSCISFIWYGGLAWSALLDQELVLWLELIYRQAMRPWVQAVYYITLHIKLYNNN